MKSEWKWNVAAQIGLVLIIALAVFAVMFTLIYIVPSAEKFHQDRGTELWPPLQDMINVARFMHRTVIIWGVLLVGALALFEWKCKTENKALIRTVIGVVMSLVWIALACWVAGTTMISLVLLH